MIIPWIRGAFAAGLVGLSLGSIVVLWFCAARYSRRDGSSDPASAVPIVLTTGAIMSLLFVSSAVAGAVIPDALDGLEGQEAVLGRSAVQAPQCAAWPLTRVVTVRVRPVGIVDWTCSWTVAGWPAFHGTTVVGYEYN